MPTKKTSKPGTVPEWFPKLADTAPYSTVQVAPEEVEEWLDDLAQGYRDSGPETRLTVPSVSCLPSKTGT
jgi:hypothetical protein